MVDFVSYNRKAWDLQVEKGNIWTQPVSPSVIEEARNGNWDIVLTPTKPIQKDWFPPLGGKKVLCLASGGGQQGPILAAAGADVIVFDNSAKQLKQDEIVAERDHLNLRTELGDMRDLSRFGDGSFDLIVHPVSNCFVDIVLPVWKEAYRVLKRGGFLLAGFINPIVFIFDLKAWNAGELIVRHKIPYSDTRDLTEEELRELILDQDEPLSFGHTLHDLIQGQIEAGFLIAGFYEDIGEGPLDQYINCMIATKAIKF